MKKILGIASWISAVVGVLSIIVSFDIWKNYILFYVGIGLLVIGIVGIVTMASKTKELIWNLLDWL